MVNRSQNELQTSNCTEYQKSSSLRPLTSQCHIMPCSRYKEIKKKTINPFQPSVPINGTLSKSVDQDETPHNVASHQGPHCLLKRKSFYV